MKSYKMKTIFLLFCLVLSTTPVFAEELVVSAASSLTNAFGEIGAAYEKSVLGAKITLNFGASGQLLQQIDKGAPADLFASADLDTMDKAGSKGLIDVSTRTVIAQNTLVLAVPVNGEARISGLADLSSETVERVAIGDPGFVPAGKYAKQSLGSAGAWDAIQPKLVFGANVRQVLDYLSRGEVDAGIVFGTDAALAKDTVKMAAILDGHDQVAYPMAVVSGSKNADYAKRFIEFVKGPEGRKILQKFGFALP